MFESGALDDNKEIEKFGTFDGLLLEPMNPGYLLNTKLKYERGPREELVDNRWKPILLNWDQITYLMNYFTKIKNWDALN